MSGNFFRKNLVLPYFCIHFPFVVFLLNKLYNRNMNKYIILASVLGVIIIIALVGLGKYSLLDSEYLFGWGRFKPFPEEIRKKHSATIERVDAFIIKEIARNEVTSHSEKFDLENYLGIIRVGVLTELYKKNPQDPFMQDVESLADDIEKYIKEKGRRRY